HMEERLGGAGAVAMLCASLGGETTLVAPGSPHSPAERLLGDAGVQWRRDRPPSRLSAKQRLVCGGRLLHDRTDVNEFSSQPVDSHLPVGAPPVAVILVADHGLGAIGPQTLAALRRLHPKTPIVVDPARGADWRQYCGATIIKCNAAEAKAARAKQADARAELALAHLIVTDGADGMTLDGQPIAAERSQVVDVTGAGDTVLAVLGLCLARGIELQNACRFANRAAALQVGKLGVQPVTWDEILQLRPHPAHDAFEEWVSEFRRRWVSGAA
ncbi:MAG TPA: PfkB family carbohydrate kinase, partial [Pirellulales bacterium]|nr:PfkB family carbohydrate kinase [Pirellulales bacterium]